MVRAIFGLPALFAAVDALDERLQADMQNRLYLELQDILHEQTLWYLRNASPEVGISEEIGRTSAIVKRLNRSLAKILPADICRQVRTREARLTEQGLAPEAARAISIQSANRHVLDIIHVARETGRKPVDAGRVFFALGEALGIHDLLAGAAEVPANGYFDRLAFDRIVGETIAEQRRLTGVVLMSGGKVAKALEKWFRANELQIERVCGAIADLTVAGPVTLARLTVINGYLHDLG
jgi:glutamate dehydrogenase